MDCVHDWKLGPYYVMAAVTYEEPRFYPPQGMVRVEHCMKCGLLRLTETQRIKIGENLA